MGVQSSKMTMVFKIFVLLKHTVNREFFTLKIFVTPDFCALNLRRIDHTYMFFDV